MEDRVQLVTVSQPLWDYPSSSTNKAIVRDWSHEDPGGRGQSRYEGVEADWVAEEREGLYLKKLVRLPSFLRDSRDSCGCRRGMNGGIDVLLYFSNIVVGLRESDRSGI